MLMVLCLRNRGAGVCCSDLIPASLTFACRWVRHHHHPNGRAAAGINCNFDATAERGRGWHRSQELRHSFSFSVFSTLVDSIFCCALCLLRRLPLFPIIRKCVAFKPENHFSIVCCSRHLDDTVSILHSQLSYIFAVHVRYDVANLDTTSIINLTVVHDLADNKTCRMCTRMTNVKMCTRSDSDADGVMLTKQGGGGLLLRSHPSLTYLCVSLGSASSSSQRTRRCWYQLQFPQAFLVLLLILLTMATMAMQLWFCRPHCCNLSTRVLR